MRRFGRTHKYVLGVSTSYFCRLPIYCTHYCPCTDPKYLILGPWYDGALAVLSIRFPWFLIGVSYSSTFFTYYLLVLESSYFFGLSTTRACRLVFHFWHLQRPLCILSTALHCAQARSDVCPRILPGRCLFFVLLLFPKNIRALLTQCQTPMNLGTYFLVRAASTLHPQTNSCWHSYCRFVAFSWRLTTRNRILFSS